MSRLSLTDIKAAWIRVTQRSVTKDIRLYYLYLLLTFNLFNSL